MSAWYTVLWSGRGAMPHQLREAEYWQQPRNSTLEAAIADTPRAHECHTDLPYDRPPVRPNPVTQTCACGAKYRTRIPTLRVRCEDCQKRLTSA